MNSGVHELLTHVVDEVHAICGTLATELLGVGSRSARSLPNPTVRSDGAASCGARWNLEVPTGDALLIAR